MESTTGNQTALALQQRLEKAEHLYTIADDIRVSYIWVVFILGFPGNLFSIITVLAMRTLTPATLYVSVLALCDGLTLAAKLIGHQMISHGVHFGTVSCKAFFIINFLSAMGNWMLVLICAERCVSVCLPLKRNSIYTVRRAVISIAVLAVVLFTIFSIMYCVMRDVTYDRLECGTVNEYLAFWTDVWYWINSCIHLFIPLPIIITLTAIIIRGMRQSRRDRRIIMTSSNGHDPASARLLKETERMERNLTIMLILVAVIFMVLSLPATIHILAYEESDDALIQARWNLFDQIQYVCVDSSHALNFFLYFFSAKRFREQFIYLITCHKWPKSLRDKKTNRGNHSTIATKYTMVARSHEDVSRI